MLLTGFFPWLAQSVFLGHLSREGSARNDLGLPHQSSIEKMPHRLAYEPM